MPPRRSVETRYQEPFVVRGVVTVEAGDTATGYVHVCPGGNHDHPGSPKDSSVTLLTSTPQRPSMGLAYSQMLSRSAMAQTATTTQAVALTTPLAVARRGFAPD